MRRYIILFLISISIYTIHFQYSQHGIYGDGNAYWAHAHALFFRGDLEYSDIYDHLQHFQGKNYIFDRTFWSMKPTDTGKLPNPWFIGTSLLWLPFLFAAKIIFQLLGFFPDSFSKIWEFIPGAAGVYLSLMGLVIIETTLKTFFSPQISKITTLTLFFSTNIFFYTAIEPALSHSAIFFVNSLFIFFWIKINKKYIHFLTLGLLLGLSTIIRASGITLCILLVYKIFHSNFHNQERIKYILISAAGFIYSISPQLLVQKILFGSVFSISYLTGYHGTPEFNLKYIPLSLFSPQRGLFFWTPILIFAYISLTRQVFVRDFQLQFFRLQQYKQQDIIYIFRALALFLLANLFFVGSWNGVLSAGFSNRFFIETYPVLALGLAISLKNSKPKWRNLLILFSTYWNLVLLLQFFTDKSRLIDQQGVSYINIFLGQLTTPFNILTNFIDKINQP